VEEQISQLPGRVASGFFGYDSTQLEFRIYTAPMRRLHPAFLQIFSNIVFR